MDEQLGVDAAPVKVRDREPEIRQRVEDILSEARRQGAAAAEVVASESLGLGVSVRRRELESVEFNQDRGFGLTVYLGGEGKGLRKGSASTSDVRQESIRDMVAAALNIARHTEADEHAGLPDVADHPDSGPELDLYHPWAVDADAATELALACESAGLDVDAAITNSEGAQVNTQQVCQVFGNSNGFLGAMSGTRHSASCVLLAERNGAIERDYWYTMARSADRLDSMADVGIKAGQRTVERLDPRSVQTGRWPVIFAPEVAAGLLGHLMGALAGSAVYRKASFLHDAMGQRALASHLTVEEQPHLPQRIGSASFDGEGVATRDQAFVAEGIVQSWMLSSYSARRLGLRTTGNAGGAHNLTLRGRTLPKAELLAAMGTGLYVTELMGQGVNGVTGDYSRGASGFWIENGERVYPIAGVTIAGNLKTMFQQIEALGDDVDERGNYCAPSVWIAEMTVAGSD
ncbi:MAG: metalloprotease PmbA [Pseudomonadota bacterium]